MPLQDLRAKYDVFLGLVLCNKQSKLEKKYFFYSDLDLRKVVNALWASYCLALIWINH